MNKIDKNIKTERDQLIRDEGLRLFPYRCTAGKLTVGIGRNLDNNPLTADEAMVFLLRRPHIHLNNTELKEIRRLLTDDFLKNGITEQEAYYLLDNDIQNVQNELLKNLPWIDNAPEEVKNILTNMAFQMGIRGLLSFRNTLRFIQRGEYQIAAENMKKSLWFRQTPARARRLINRMKRITS